MTSPGTLVAGRYRLLDELARGGMGTVWKARDERLQRLVAVKLLHPPVGASAAEAEQAADRALREARTTAKLHHPHAVPVFDVVEHEGRPCLVMQYLPSRNLQAVLDDTGRMPARDVARLGAELASALAAAHRVGIIHRDVKPANVLVTEDGTAKLTDFGISHTLGDASTTSTGFVTGTPAYLAPEVARGDPAGFASDVYSLGSTLYRAVEGAPPYGAESNAMAVLHRVASGRYVPPSPSGPLTPLLQQLLAADPAARPPVHNVATALRELASGSRARVVSAGAPRPAPTTATPTVRPVPPRPTAPPVLPPPAAAPLEPRRRRLGWLMAAVVAVLLVAGVVAYVATRPDGSTPQADASSAATAASGTPTAADTPPADDTPSDTASDTGSPTPTPTDTGAPTATELSDAVTSYYDLLPGDTDAGWERLTAGYQVSPSGGRSGYDEFWGGISSVSVSDVQASPPDTVVATLAYVFTDGSTSTERTSFGFVREDGVLKIASSSVLSRG